MSDVSPVSLHCGRYEEHLLKERGLCERTVEGYVAVVRDFLSGRFDTGPVEFTTLEAGAVGDYLLDQARTRSPNRVANLTTALRQRRGAQGSREGGPSSSDPRRAHSPSLPRSPW